MPAMKVEVRRAMDALEAVLAEPEPSTLETQVAYAVALIRATLRLQLLMWNKEE